MSSLFVVRFKGVKVYILVMMLLGFGVLNLMWFFSMIFSLMVRLFLCMNVCRLYWLV